MQGLPPKLRVLGELGRGAMGVVLDAHDELLGRRVAVKVLADGAGEVERARLLREARAASQLRSPHAVRLFEAGEVDGAVYVVMERLEGEPLGRRVDRDGPLPIGDALRVAREILGALGEAHALGIVHRDIKPGNVMLVRDGAGVLSAKLLDFGLARMEGAPRLTLTGEALGSPAYMAPEQIRAERADARADVWAFGVTLYEMLSGELPFHAGSVPGMLKAILTDAPAPLPPSRAPAALWAFVARCLAKDPAARFRDGYEALAALEGEQLARTTHDLNARAAPDAGSPAPHGQVPGLLRPPPDRPAVGARRGRRAAWIPFVAGLLFVAVLGSAGLGVALYGWSRRSRVAIPPPREVTDAGPAPPASPEPSGVVSLVPEAGPAPTPSDVPRSRPVFRRVDEPGPHACVCIGATGFDGRRNKRALCLGPVHFECTCSYFSVVNLCRSLADVTDAGTCSLASTRWEPSLRREPCVGVHPVERIERSGKVDCNACTGYPRYAGATAGAPCRGFDITGEYYDGTWTCGI